MAEATFDLHDASQFQKAMQQQVRHRATPLAVDGLFCPTCGTSRRVDLSTISNDPSSLPALGAMRCRQCHKHAHGIVYAGPTGLELVIVRSVPGGVATPNTPEAVKYYLDQAGRSESAGARSAAVAMYRAALEQLLFGQGFTSGMLDAKIKALEAAIATGNGPTWGPRLDTEFLRVLKELGNGAIHTNGGDVKKQAVLDGALLLEVRATFEAVLDLIYEEPARKTASLAKLKAAAAIVK